MWEDLAAVLEGSIVRLEPLEARHEQGLYEAADNLEVWRWLPYDAIETREAFGAWMRAAVAASVAGTEAAFAILDRRSGVPVGSTRYLALKPEHRVLEIGWTWLTPSAWGTGANVEAKLLLLRYAFECLGCQRVEFKTDARNERSRAALAALPARFEGVFRKHMLVWDGQVRDSAYYSVIDDEWPEVRDNLWRRLASRSPYMPKSNPRR